MLWTLRRTAQVVAPALILLSLAACDDTPPDHIEGAGGTFLSPLVDAWISGFEHANDKAVIIDYEPTGSGVGLDLLAKGKIDFAFSEIAPAPDQMDAGTYVQIPVAAGALVVAFNLDGIEALQLSRAALAGIFLGQITSWSDPAIGITNPEVVLPDIPVTVVHRVDPSGSTFEISSFLSSVSEEWRVHPGVGSTIQWPTGRGALGTNAMLSQIENRVGAIGYADMGRVDGRPKIGIASIENRGGRYVPQSQDGIVAALKDQDIDDPLSLLDPDGIDASPLTMVSYLFIRPSDVAQKTDLTLRDFALHILESSPQVTSYFGFAPLPDAVRQRYVDQLREDFP